MSKETVSIKERNKAEKYKKSSLLGKLALRIKGENPSRAIREALHREKIGPVGSALEDVNAAIIGARSGINYTAADYILGGRVDKPLVKQLTDEISTTNRKLASKMLFSTRQSRHILDASAVVRVPAEYGGESVQGEGKLIGFIRVPNAPAFESQGSMYKPQVEGIRREVGCYELYAVAFTAKDGEDPKMVGFEKLDGSMDEQDAAMYSELAQAARYQSWTNYISDKADSLAQG